MIPDTIVAHNMSFSSAEFRDFFQAWNFTISTLSPNFRQSSGLVERILLTIKRVIRKAKRATSVYLVLLEYRHTPISSVNLSPAQFLMSRRLRSKLPLLESLLKPAINPF